MKHTHPRTPHGGGSTCGAHGRQRGQPCAKPAGWGTSHPGRGRCRLHGGLKKGGGDRREVSLTASR